ncbi:MAG TPA: glycosyltransferase family 39 protein [Thermoanaerobaculia bacterium]|nr:glycosyltransferase family 39 protein [Thermoanaerobaculia bacterium]
MSRSERIALIAFAAVSLVLRSIAFFHYRFDSDEPQHLHVAWGWTVGLVQYRDLFDNHAPLFHIASAPLLRLLGERSNILFFMRAAMLPLFAIVVLCTYLIGKRLYSQTVGLWAAVLLSLFPPFFLKSLEYRTDNLWNTLWIVALAILILKPPSAFRWFLAGLLLGAAMAVSLKTILLVVTLAGAGLITRTTLRDRTSIGRPIAAAAAGLTIVPAIVALYFVSLGAWSNLVYCVFEFNTLIERVRPHVAIERILWPFAIAAIVLMARRSTQRDLPRMFCAAAFAVFMVTLAAFWILISPRDMLPMMPIGAIFAVSVIDRLDDRLIVRTATAVALIVPLYYYANRFENRTDAFVTMMNQVLRLTRPDEPIMDFKGETIYRRRPYYYIFEAITHEAMEKNLLPDRVPEAVIAARCYVAQADGSIFPPRARAFLNANFMDLGRLRAAGQWIAADGTFSIAVPGRYVIIDEIGEAIGSLDGSIYEGSQEMTAGPHRFQRAKTDERLAVLWAPAFERGFSPFHLQDRNFRYRGRRSR